MGRDDLAKIADFQRRALSLVCLALLCYIESFDAAEIRILPTQTVGAMLMKIPFCVDKCILRRTARGNVDENSCLMSVKIFCVGLLGAMLMKNLLSKHFIVRNYIIKTFSREENTFTR